MGKTNMLLSTALLLALNPAGHPQDVGSVTGLAYGNNTVRFRFLKLHDLSRNGFAEQKDRSKRIVSIYRSVRKELVTGLIEALYSFPILHTDTKSPQEELKYESSSCPISTKGWRQNL